MALLLLIPACDLYDLDSQPSTSLSPEIALADISGYEALMNSVYNRSQRQELQGYLFLVAPDVLADNVYMQASSSGRFVGQSSNNHGAHVPATPTGGSHTYFTTYRLINEANHIIANVDEADGATDEVVTRLRGEAHFMRALTYHDAVKIWAYEPDREVGGWNLGLVLQTEPTQDIADVEFSGRNTNEEVYQQIESDMLTAIDLLSQGDRGVYYANHAAAHALAARVYLYWERWQDAIDHATEALDLAAAEGIGLATEGELANNTFDSHPNPESIFELDYDPQNESTGVNASAASVLTPAQWYDVLPAPEIIEAYEEEDLRHNWYAENDGGFDWDIYTVKFNQSRGGPGTWADNVPIFRTPEMYLIIAEAYAELDDHETGLEYLNELRDSRNASPASANNADELIDAVMHERRLELIFEGHRFFDLKRRGMDITKPAHSSFDTVPYDDVRVLAPFPTSQVDNNPNFEQNPGY